MTNIKRRLADVDWESVAESLHAKGYAHVPDLLSAVDCDRTIANYDESKFYRKTIMMERYRFGLGSFAGCKSTFASNTVNLTAYLGNRAGYSGCTEVFLTRCSAVSSLTVGN